MIPILIQRDDTGEHVFTHYRDACLNEDDRNPMVSSRVEFDIQDDGGKPKAVNVMAIGGGNCAGGRHHGIVTEWDVDTGTGTITAQTGGEVTVMTANIWDVPQSLCIGDQVLFDPNGGRSGMHRAFYVTKVGGMIFLCQTCGAMGHMAFQCPQNGGNGGIEPTISENTDIYGFEDDPIAENEVNEHDVAISDGKKVSNEETFGNAIQCASMEQLQHTLLQFIKQNACSTSWIEMEQSVSIDSMIENERLSRFIGNASMEQLRHALLRFMKNDPTAIALIAKELWTANAETEQNEEAIREFTDLLNSNTKKKILHSILQYAKAVPSSRAAFQRNSKPPDKRGDYNYDSMATDITYIKFVNYMKGSSKTKSMRSILQFAKDNPWSVTALKAHLKPSEMERNDEKQVETNETKPTEHLSSPKEEKPAIKENDGGLNEVISMGDSNVISVVTQNEMNVVEYDEASNVTPGRMTGTVARWRHEKVNLCSLFNWTNKSVSN